MTDNNQTYNYKRPLVTWDEIKVMEDKEKASYLMDEISLNLDEIQKVQYLLQGLYLSIIHPVTWEEEKEISSGDMFLWIKILGEQIDKAYESFDRLTR